MQKLNWALQRHECRAPLRMLVCATLLSATVDGQIVNDGATNTLSNTNTIITGDATIGTNGSFTLLILSDNASLTNSVNGLIGRNATARSNEVRLISPSARWQMGGSLFVGSNGGLSRLVVSNGALVENINGSLATRIESSNNLALVTGNGSLWSNRLDLLVGGQGRGNQMIVSNGGWTVSRSGIVGNNASASNNLALITGNGSVWSNALNLRVGFLGQANRLVIEAGGLAHCDAGTVGDFNSASNSEALVTGPGSLWTNVSFLTIGSQVPRNRLVVSNGAAVRSGAGVVSSFSNHVVITGTGSVWSNQTTLSLGGGSNRIDVSDGGWLACNDASIGPAFGANSNAVLLTGNGSGWNNLGHLIVGQAGNGNVLIASNGATVLSSNATIGVNGSTANHNLAVITGAGTLWSNRHDLTLGSFGAGNRLQVDNGATVLSGNFFLGFNTLSATNRVTVNGGTLRVTNAAGTGMLDVRRGTGSLLAGLVDVDRLVVTNAAGAFEINGGTLVSRGTIISNIDSFLVRGSPTNPATWDVRAGTSLHSIGVPLFVGNDLPFNRMFITNGATLNGVNSFIGANIGGNSNSVLLSGSGSKWAAGSLSVGYSGAFNRMIVSNGATADSFQGDIGADGSGSNNLAIVTGAGSLWTNRSELYVGQGGSGNQLIISNGGTVFAQVAHFLGHDDGSVSNTVLVTGPGSAWLGPGTIRVGGPGSGCQVMVSEGGRVEDSTGIIGSGSIHNSVIVTGAGSLWSNAGDFFVGQSGSSNRLQLSSGGQMRAVSTFIGHLSGGKNVVVVTDPGTVLSNSSYTLVGYDGSDNHLVISNGGFATNGLDVLIGLNDLAENNIATLSGAGSRWVVNRFLEVGHSGDDNELVVEGGASLGTGKAAIGVLSNSEGNSIDVLDPGTTWTNHSSLEIGSAGYNNALFVLDGATVVSSNGIFGTLESANGNHALVGSAGRWLMENDLYLGGNGPANVLLVEGGLMVNSNGIIGLGATSDGNRAVVGGIGSVWSNRQDLVIGDSGSSNRLEVTQGGRVESMFGTLGGSVAGSNNAAIVEGAGSLWRAEQAIRVGFNGNGNRLIITNGGKVRGSGIIGMQLSSTNNEVLVSGLGSSWSNTSTLFIGRVSAGNRLLVSQGGEVVNTSFGAILGDVTESTNNRIVVDGGALRLLGSTGALDIRRGTNVLKAGLIEARELRLTNTLGVFEFNGGTLITRGSSISNNGPFRVGGSGTTPAIWDVRAGAAHHVSSLVVIGDQVPGCRLLVTNGAVLTSAEGFVGLGPGSHSNLVLVAGAGSRWDMFDGDFNLGIDGSFNALVISNGGRINANFPAVGIFPGSTNNQVEVIGANSWWTIRDSLRIGHGGSANRLLLSQGALVTVSNLITVGNLPGLSTNNLIQIADGMLLVTNGTATGTLDVRSGTNRLDAGLIQIDRLRLTNTAGRFELNGGNVSVGNSSVNNGQVFRVGNGASPATLTLMGNGPHSFVNGLSLPSNGTLTGNGSVTGFTLVQPGGTLAPGASVGKIIFNDSPLLQGVTAMEISKSGATLTNDQIQVNAALTFGGALIVTNLGPTALAAGDRFHLFNASSFGGTFSAISLPPLLPGLSWINQLLLDGSIEVTVAGAPAFTAISLVGTNILLVGTNGTPGANHVILTATNVALPLSDWLALTTNQFDAGGGFRFTNSIAPGERQRYFRIRSP